MLLMATALSLGCTDTTTTADSGDGPLSCAAEAPTPFPIATGTWDAVTAEALYNHCENDAGNGPHIHLGNIDPLEFVAEGDCLYTTANETFPAAMEGYHDGTDFQLEGSFINEWGTCDLQVDATFAGAVTAADSFSYTFHLKVTDLNEYCAVGVGETDAHTYKQLPCELSWTGTATPRVAAD